MIKLASPRNECSPVSAKSPLGGRKRMDSNQWLVGIPTAHNKYEFIASPIPQLPVTNRRNHPRKVGLFASGSFAPTWKAALNGLFVLAFVGVVFGVSAWMLCHLTFEFATFGDAQVLEFWKRY